jgi:hypothetical protein
MSVRFRGNVFTEPLIRKGLHNSVVLLLHACMLRALHSNDRCLQSHCLATGLYAVIIIWIQTITVHHFPVTFFSLSPQHLTRSGEEHNISLEHAWGRKNKLFSGHTAARSLFKWRLLKPLTDRAAASDVTYTRLEQSGNDSLQSAPLRVARKGAWLMRYPHTEAETSVPLK